MKTFFSTLGPTFLFECTINATDIADSGSTWSFPCYTAKSSSPSSFTVSGNGAS